MKFLCERIGQTNFFWRNVRPGGGLVGFQVASLVLFLYFCASPPLFRKYPSREAQIAKKHRKTKLNNMAVVLRVSILFSLVLRALNFDFSKATFFNRYNRYSYTAHQTNRGW